MISVIEEYEQTSEQLRNWIEEILENNKEKLIVAESRGQIVGTIVFRSKSTKRLSHTGSFTAMVKKEYRNQGIGKLLIKELLNWAEHNTLIEKVSLGVLSTNQRAIELYKSMGFVEEGRKIKEVKLSLVMTYMWMIYLCINWFNPFFVQPFYQTECYYIRLYFCL